jgi:K+-transporting ATPase ATPase C chain
MNIRSVWLKSSIVLIIFTLLCGGLYPLLVTFMAQNLFPYQANGSLMHIHGKVAGSMLLAQNNNIQGYFYGRPSACGYSTLPSGASNFAPTSAALYDSIISRKSRFFKENGLADGTKIPMEMLCSSGSGLDPHISPDAAKLQVERIARQRHMNTAQKQRLYEWIVRGTEPRQWGVLGEPRVNVLRLNSLLDNDPEFRTLKSMAKKGGEPYAENEKAPTP